MCFKSYGQNFIKSNFNTAITKVEQKEKYVSHIFANVDFKWCSKESSVTSVCIFERQSLSWDNNKSYDVNSNFHEFYKLT